jgi:large subunit ribosomal protein L9
LKVILTKYHEKLGDIGDEVEVKSGYANNYLIPNGLAVPFTRGNLNQMKLVKQAALKVEARNIKEAEELAGKLSELEITFVVKTGEEGKLYGSITSKDIAQKILEERKIEIDRKKVDLQEHIKELGEYDIDLKLYREIKTSVKVKVEPDKESKQLIEEYKAQKEKEKEEEEKVEKEKPGKAPEDEESKPDAVMEKSKKGKAEKGRAIDKYKEVPDKKAGKDSDKTKKESE